MGLDPIALARAELLDGRVGIRAAARALGDRPLHGGRREWPWTSRSAGSSVHRLEARASVANGRGNGVLRKLGAVPEGVLRQSLQQASERVDQILWAMLDEEWFRSGAVPAYDLTPPARLPEVAQPQASPRAHFATGLV